MASRSELMQRLAVLPTYELLRLLTDDTILEIASRCFTVGAQASIMTPPLTANEPETPPVDKAKRPLNAFMAFRTYYLKLFPEIQQKAASGFLTTLWNKDPFRNKWALVAKVYSFVRDEIGKDKISLSYFLGFCCPAMGILHPRSYLAALGWSVEGDETVQRLVQDELIAADGQIQYDCGTSPRTDIELLDALIHVGYLPEYVTSALIETLRASNANSIIATPQPTLSLPVTYTPTKFHFMNTIRTDPVQATRELLGDACNHIPGLSVRSYEVDNLDSIHHLPMQPEVPDPRYYYNYSVSHSQLASNNGPVLRFDNIPEYETFDIDSPWDVDAMLGQDQSEGQRTATHPKSPKHEPREDFHYTFG